jgi:putative lipoic acid-binding regulatory protein
VVQAVDEAVNNYPCERVFTAIGEGSVDFKAAMVSCVEEGLNCTVCAERVVVRPSSGGKYQSVRIGPVIVAHAGKVIDVFALMKKDQRLKWFL